MSDTAALDDGPSLFGSVLTRCFHLLLTLVPIFYYFHPGLIARHVVLTATQCVVAMMLLILLLEALLFRMRWASLRWQALRRMASFSWLVLSVGIVLLFAPGAQFATPIIGSCAIVVPVLSALRYFNVKKSWAFVWAALCVMLIWFVADMWVSRSLHLLSVPVWWMGLMGPVTVIASWLKIKGIDFTVFMHLIPLGLVLFIMQ